MGRASKKKQAKRDAALIKLDIACGQNRQQGYVGVDIWPGPNVDVVHDLCEFPWPFKDESVEEAFCSHFFEHVPGKLRGKFMDELYRILVPGARATIICPYALSTRAAQDFTHEWPPVCEASFLYFNKAWRVQNRLDHYPVTCDFDFSYAYLMTPDWATRNDDARGFAIRHYWHVVNDLQVILVKRVAEPNAKA